MRAARWNIAARILALALVPGAALAQDLPFPAATNSFGMPGLIDMPLAFSPSDADLGFTSSSFARQTRHTLSFQAAPRLATSFRYALLYNIPNTPGAPPKPFRFDRSFSLHYRLLDEGRIRPALAIGLNDFVGTGVYSGEYLVASKRLGPRLSATAGIGWGRLATRGGFANPLTILGAGFATRPAIDFGEGGGFQPGLWFHGPAAVFGGVEWRASARLSLAAEYSSDAYPREDGAAFTVRSPLNFSARWRAGPGTVLSANYLYGSEFGLQAHFVLNPRRGRFGSGLDPAPPAMNPPGPAPGAPDPARFAAEGLRLTAAEVRGDLVRVTIENLALATAPQALGRAARLLTALPPAVQRFQITLAAKGVPVSTTTLQRSDLTALEFDPDGPELLLSRASIGEPTPAPDLPTAWPRGKLDLAPYLKPSLFDPKAPLRADVGLALSGSYEPLPGLVLSGVLQQKLAGNLDQATRNDPSPLPHVRSDIYDYYREGETAITRLQAAWYGRPGPALFARLTAGYLEPMFAGISGEVLWKPVNRRWALGAEVNYTAQRDYDQLFGLQDYRVASGHVSAYADLGGGYQAQLDAGRYLAGDWGATLSLDREFDNGWRIGAFATLTTVSFKDFGEGSFDKGMRITIPLAYVTGRGGPERTTLVLRPVTRDGGARLEVEGRLYDMVRELQRPELQDGWSRVWR